MSMHHWAPSPKSESAPLQPSLTERLNDSAAQLIALAVTPSETEPEILFDLPILGGAPAAAQALLQASEFSDDVASNAQYVSGLLRGSNFEAELQAVHAKLTALGIDILEDGFAQSEGGHSVAALIRGGMAFTLPFRRLATNAPFDHSAFLDVAQSAIRNLPFRLAVHILAEHDPQEAQAQKRSREGVEKLFPITATQAAHASILSEYPTLLGDLWTRYVEDRGLEKLFVAHSETRSGPEMWKAIAQELTSKIVDQVAQAVCLTDEELRAFEGCWTAEAFNNQFLEVPPTDIGRAIRAHADLVLDIRHDLQNFVTDNFLEIKAASYATLQEQHWQRAWEEQLQTIAASQSELGAVTKVGEFAPLADEGLNLIVGALRTMTENLEERAAYHGGMHRFFRYADPVMQYAGKLLLDIYLNVDNKLVADIIPAERLAGFTRALVHYADKVRSCAERWDPMDVHDGTRNLPLGVAAALICLRITDPQGGEREIRFGRGPMNRLLEIAYGIAANYDKGTLLLTAPDFTGPCLHTLQPDAAKSRRRATAQTIEASLQKLFYTGHFAETIRLAARVLNERSTASEDERRDDQSGE